MMVLPPPATMRQRFYSRWAMGGALLLLAVGALAVAYVGGFRRADSLPVISGIKVMSAHHAPASLEISGSGLEQPLEAVLLPSPVLKTGDPRELVPRTALFHLDAAGDLALASGRGRRILTIDVRDGYSPRILGTLKLQAKSDSGQAGLTALVISGNRAVVSLGGHDGLVLVDLTDPTAPRQLDHLPFKSDITDFMALDGRIIAAGVRSGLWSIGIAGDRLQVTPIAGARKAWRLARSGDRLAAVGLDGNLDLYELAGATTPRLVASERIPAEIRGVAMSDKALYLCQADGVLREYSTARWPRLVPQAELRLPGRALRLVKDEDAALLYCILVGAGAAAIDTSQPGQLSVAGWLNTRSSVAALAVAQGRLIYVNNNGLMIRSTAELLRQQQVSFIVPFATGREKVQLMSWQGLVLAYDHGRVAVLGRHAGGETMGRPPAKSLLPLAGGQQVRFFARQGDALEPVAALPVPYAVQATFLRDHRLYVLGEKTLNIFNCSEVPACEPLGHLDGFGVAEAMAWVDPHYLLVADRIKGLTLVSVREPAHPRVAAELPVPAFLQGSGGGAFDVLVDGQRAYVSRGTFGLEVVDLADPERMRPVQLLDTPGSARRLLLTQGLLLAADRGQGLQVFETRGPDCRWLGTIATSSNIEDLVRSQDDILISTTASTITTLTAPVRLEKLEGFDGKRARVGLPDGLPAGNYRLVVYGADNRMAKADFSLP